MLDVEDPFDAKRVPLIAVDADRTQFREDAFSIAPIVIGQKTLYAVRVCVTNVPRAMAVGSVKDREALRRAQDVHGKWTMLDTKIRERLSLTTQAGRSTIETVFVCDDALVPLAGPMIRVRKRRLDAMLSFQEADNIVLYDKKSSWYLMLRTFHQLAQHARQDPDIPPLGHIPTTTGKALAVLVVRFSRLMASYCHAKGIPVIYTHEKKWVSHHHPEAGVSMTITSPGRSYPDVLGWRQLLAYVGGTPPQHLPYAAPAITSIATHASHVKQQGVIDPVFAAYAAQFTFDRD